MTDTDYSKFVEGIRKTGFPLEYRTAQSLRSAGWTVISGKYYLDDTNQIPREIDLIAYKVGKFGRINVYTTVIVSCKKSERGAWALLARSLDLKDPNMDWWPLHIWSNDKAVEYGLSESGQNKKYHNDAQALGVTDALRIPGADVFAFQEMNLASGAPQNDKPIFDAISSLVQAQAYELGALPSRKKEPAVYQFNLLSVSESELIRLDFTDTGVDAKPITSEHYIARYIVKRRESFSRIHFVKAAAFDEVLKDYSRLHAANCKLLERIDSEFFADVLAVEKRRVVYLADFREALAWQLKWRVQSELKMNVDFKELTLGWKNAPPNVQIEIGFDKVIIDFLNGDKVSKQYAAKALKKVYRFEGAFAFAEEEIPF
jgi:hypothetical protein